MSQRRFPTITLTGIRNLNNAIIGYHLITNANFRKDSSENEGVRMNCINGHACPDSVAFCPTCGTNSFSSSAPAYPSYAASAPLKTTNGLAIASMVLGIVWVYWIGSVLALIFGLVARKQIREGGQGGDGMAIAGIVLGIIGLVTLVITIIVIVAASNSTQFGN